MTTKTNERIQASFELPNDVPQAIRQMKSAWRASIGDVPALIARIMADLEADIEDIERAQAEGGSAWPEVTFDDIHHNTLTEAMREQIKKRGCVVVREHFSATQAKTWDKELVTYVEQNDFDNQYRGAGDDFFGTLSASRPEIFPIYWSKAQMEARQSERMHTVQTFLNGFWKVQSEGKQWFDPNVSYIYPDRVRRRPPGTTSGGLGPHTDSGALERWLLPAYNKVFRHLLTGHYEQYDPWDAAYRPEVDEYVGGTTKCSAFRTFQGWTALCDIKRDQGVLFTIPLPAAMAYLLIRPLLDDVPEDELCGVSPRRVLPVDEKWHSLLLRAKALIPDLNAGDSVWWHCDLIHGVEPVEHQQGWGNVMYIPAAPGCEKNRRYAQQCAQDFKQGRSPDDFPEEHYETEWEGRFQWSDLNDNGRKGFASEA
ncbi:DUF1479 family protein [Marinomonas sp. M1K-6]|jgi:hypothetical protein|uniref:DUF1479 family protein n=1 Tax=Marinomonas profundi TaxID=2726122 RepID=A0A847R467_9GAMM|nr:YbiU family protein [Marinomonas profundi]NLQ18762.1 DUF1479 family protein [Marinomonas profundi]UDV03992.1 DUF1479 domain-containing protein [Marinomonas profundi]